jgi:hypothetical protein
MGMKTTLDISDALLMQAKEVAQRDGTTMRSLVEEGLRTILATRKKPPKPFKLRDGSVGRKGDPGLTPEVMALGGMSALRDLANDREWQRGKK